MSRINWNEAGSRHFEAGVDRGVLYVDGSGVPWNGLISVSENKVGGETKTYYLDGERVHTRIMPSEFSATLKAYASPVEFDKVDGTVEIYNGISSTHQPRRPFGLSYRTLLGSDTQQTRRGYKLHVLYNLYAEPSEQEHQTLTDSPEASALSWNLSATPTVVGPGHRPTAHFVIDSTRVSPQTLVDMENLLYGGTVTSPVLPTVQQMLDIFAAYTVFKLTVLADDEYSVEGSAVTSNGDGTFTMDHPDVNDTGNNTFSIE